MTQRNPQELKAAIAAVFDRAAPTYDDVITYFGHFGERVADLAGVGPGERVLDVACGTGACLLAAARAAGPTGSVVGVDLSPGMLERVRERADAAGLGNVDARLMDAEQLDFPDGSFDVVTCAFGIMFLPHLEVGLREFRRVVRAGGRVAVAVWAGATPDWGFGKLAQEFGGVNFEAGPPPPWKDDSGMAALVEAAGLRRVQVLSEEAGFEFADDQTWWRWQHSHGALGNIESVPAENAAAFKAAALQRYRSLADAAGRCKLTQRARIGLGRA